MSIQQCAVHTGPLSPVSAFPAVRFIHEYLSLLDSLDLSSYAPSKFYADSATLYASDNSIHKTSQTIWNWTKSSCEQFGFMYHQTCLTRLFGTDLKSIGAGERHIISLQTIMLCRLKNWEEERMVEIPKTFEFVVGPVEERRREERGDVDEDVVGEQDSGVDQQTEVEEQQEQEEEDERGFEGLQIYETRVWWDSGILAKAIAEKEKEEEKRRFREILTLNRGFLGQSSR